MVSKDKKWVDNEVLYASDLNSNVMQPLSNLDATDDADITFTNTSYTTKYTINIDADTISNYVIIKCIMYAEGFYGTGGGTTVNTTQFTIDSVQKFERAITGNTIVEQFENSVYRSITFKYTPTSDEKTNGFTIDIDSKKSGHISGVTKTGGFQVWGA